ncbi:MAG: co-chaperone GroES [Planctomycetia bacterium]|nr:co-chaperone GroES [Planctomycetia bacterium]
MKLVPLGEKVIVRQQDAQTVTAGGIALPEGAREKPAQGKVLAVGDGRLLENGTYAPLQVCEGDRVLFEKYFGCKITLDNVEYIILNESEILAVIG